MKKTILITTLTFNFLLLTVTLLLSTFYSVAQPTIQWQKSLGGSNNETANSVIQTLDGGYIVAGGTTSNDGDVTLNKGGTDCWVVKLDVNGNIQWQKTYGGSGDESISSILQTTDGGYIFAASSNSNDGDISNSYINWDYWIVKIDSVGNIQWEKSLGGSDSDFAYEIKQTLDSGYVVTGQSKSTDGDVTGNHGFEDYWVVKLDGTGTIQWEKSLGGTNTDISYSMNLTNDLGFIVVGSSTSNDGDVLANYGGRDFWVVKLDSLGNIQWEKNFGGSFDEIPVSVVQTTNSEYLILGNSGSNDGDVTGHHGTVTSNDYWIIKLDSLGTLLWQKSIGGTLNDSPEAMKTTVDGGCVLFGASPSNDGDVSVNYGGWDYWLVKLDSLGNIEWEKNYGGSDWDFGYAVSQTIDNGYILVGSSPSVDVDVTGNNGSFDYWVVKLNPVLGIGENKQDNITIFPNPTNGVFILNTDFNEGVIKIFDVLGKLIQTQSIKQHRTIIDIEQHSKGIYIVKIRTSNRLITQKIIYK